MSDTKTADGRRYKYAIGDRVCFTDNEGIERRGWYVRGILHGKVMRYNMWENETYLDYPVCYIPEDRLRFHQISDENTAHIKDLEQEIKNWKSYADDYNYKIAKCREEIKKLYK